MDIIKVILMIILVIVAIFLSITLYGFIAMQNSVLGLAMGTVLICGWIGAIILGILEFIAWKR